MQTSRSMSVLTGILVDVSLSMKENVGDRKVERTASSWVKSAFKFIDRLVKHDTSSDHRVFAIGLGSSRRQTIFDILTTLKRLEVKHGERKRDMLAEMIRIIKCNGAHRISEWVTIAEIVEVVDERDSRLTQHTKNNSEFRKKFISELLPVYCRKESQNLSKKDMLEKAMDILEKNGAPRVRNWATVEEISAQIDTRMTTAIFDALNDYPGYRHKFINQCLPRECKEVRVDPVSPLAVAGLLTPLMPISALVLIGQRSRTEIANAALGVYPTGHQRMTENSIKDVIKKGTDLAVEEGIYIPVKDIVSRDNDLVGRYVLAEVGPTDKVVYCAKDASEILHGSVGQQELTDDRTDELYDEVKPFIYGDGTPLIESLRQAVNLFKDNCDTQYKLLFVLSDGQPRDGNDLDLRELADLGVKVVSCYITRRPIEEPRRLYSILNLGWERAAKFMFKMSSVVRADKIPRTLFVKKGWKIDTVRNETRLFFQINHPDLIDEVCDLARDCVCSQDSLTDVLSYIKLDIYINRANEGLSPDRQEEKEKTCYAIASATVIHMVLMLKAFSVGREGGYPDFYEIRDELIDMYGKDGAKVGDVLREACPRYRLQCEMTDEPGATSAVVEKRPVVAIYQLTVAERKTSLKFYKKNPTGILTEEHVKIDERSEREKLTIGHAVVLTSFDGKCLRLMNSKGSDWADGGFFRVRKADVLGMKFYDVFWTQEDLVDTSEEKRNRLRQGVDVSAKLMSSLTGLQTATYKCPLCSVESKLSEFTGHVLGVRCPRCQGTLSADGDNSDLGTSHLASISCRCCLLMPKHMNKTLRYCGPSLDPRSRPSLTDLDLDLDPDPDTIRYRYDRPTRCYFNVHSKADMSQLNLPHGIDN